MTTPLRNLIWKMPGVQIIIYVSIIQVLVWLALFSGRRRETPGNLHEFKLFHYLKVGSTNQIEKHCHMTIIKPDCAVHWNVTVMPIPFSSDNASVGTLRNYFCLNDFCFTSTVELAWTVASTSRKVLFSQLEKSSVSRALAAWMRYYSCHDITFVCIWTHGSCHGWFSYGLGTRLGLNGHKASHK